MFVKKDFPIFSRTIHDKTLVYLDSAATTQKPQCVLDAMNNFYTTSNANVSRGVHTLAEEATNIYEDARKTVAEFIGAEFEEVVFVPSATYGMNMVASWVQEWIQKDDEILLSTLEHHSNIIPWQIVAKKTGAKIIFINSKNGMIDLEDYKKKVSQKTRIISVSATSNVFGAHNPIEEIVKNKKNAFTLVDYAQTIAHKKVDASLPDFAVFSAHKIYGPMGIGVLKINQEINFVPRIYGGGMIETVTQQEHSLTQKPWCFEAGTPNVAGAVGLEAAIKYVSSLGLENIQSHEQELTNYTIQELEKIPKVKIIGPGPGIISFVVQEMNTNDIAVLLDLQGIAVRSGRHCADPLHQELNIKDSLRVSFGVYNTLDDAKKFIISLKKIVG